MLNILRIFLLITLGLFILVNLYPDKRTSLERRLDAIINILRR